MEHTAIKLTGAILINNRSYKHKNRKVVKIKHSMHDIIVLNFITTKLTIFTT